MESPSACVSWSRIQSKVPSPPTSLIQQWVSDPLTPRAFQPLHPSSPRPSSALPSTTCLLWSLTHRWAGGTRTPPRRRTYWEASARGPQMEKGRWESRPAGWTRCQSTHFLVSKGSKWTQFMFVVRSEKEGFEIVLINEN